MDHDERPETEKPQQGRPVAMYTNSGQCLCVRIDASWTPKTLARLIEVGAVITCFDDMHTGPIHAEMLVNLRNIDAVVFTDAQ